MTLQFLAETPHVHMHYLREGEAATAAGDRALLEVCCHACGDAVMVVYPWPLRIENEEHGHPVLRAMRDRFEREHHDCAESVSAPPVFWQETCCPHRRAVSTVDMTEQLRADLLPADARG